MSKKYYIYFVRIPSPLNYSFYELLQNNKIDFVENILVLKYFILFPKCKSDLLPFAPKSDDFDIKRRYTK